MGIKRLGGEENGFCNFSSNIPIRSVADMKGLKMQVMESTIYMEIMKCLGASPPWPSPSSTPRCRTARWPGMDWPDTVPPSALDPAKELRLPWNPEYDLWHSFWFSAAAIPRAVLNQMSLLEEFFSWRDNWPDSWAIAPAVVAVPLAWKLGLTLRRLENGPADEIIYYLRGPQREESLTSTFLACLNRELAKHPEVESLLHGITSPAPASIPPGYEFNHRDYD